MCTDLNKYMGGLLCERTTMEILLTGGSVIMDYRQNFGEM